MTSIIKFEDKEFQLDLTDNTIWQTQQEISEFYKVTRENITTHIGNIYEDGELQPETTCKNFLYVDSLGRERQIRKYNLDMVCHIGYRVRSDRGIQLRTKATEALKVQNSPQTPSTIEDLIIMQAQSMKDVKAEVNEIKQVQIEAIQEVKELKQEAKQLNTRLDNTPIRSDSVKRTKIHQRIKQYAIAKGGAPTHYSQAHRQLRAYFDITAYDDIPIRRYDEAMNVIQAWIDEETHQQGIQTTLYERNGVSNEQPRT